MSNRPEYKHGPPFAGGRIVHRSLFHQNVCPIVLRRWHQFLLPSNRQLPSLVLSYRHRCLNMSNRLKYNHRPPSAEGSIINRRLFRQNVCPIVSRRWHQFLLPSNRHSPGFLLFYRHRCPTRRNRLKYNHRPPSAEGSVGNRSLFRQNVCPIVLCRWHQFLLPSNRYLPGFFVSYRHRCLNMSNRLKCNHRPPSAEGSIVNRGL